MKRKLLYLIKMVSKNLLYGFVLQCILLSTVMASNLNAQVKPIDKTFVELVQKEWTLQELFSILESRTAYVFVYPDDLLPGTAPIYLNKNRQSVNDVLVQVAQSSQLKFRQVNNSIYVGKMAATENPEAIPILIEQIPVTGTVLDQAGNPIPGATILVEGTSTGTATDIEGNFSLDVPEGAVLVVSFVGYQPQRITVGSQTAIQVVLEEDQSALEEVVVVGYGTQRKINLTGAVSQVTSERLDDRPITNLDQALQGVTPGLNITSNTTLGGEPNAGMGINIRGIGSLSGGSPWVLVDGSPMDMNSINPADVESISILKDAASTAIYGSRAAYGVILITTKSGKQNEAIRTSYSNNFSAAAPTYLPGFVNSLRFAHSINEAATNSGQNAIFSDETIERIIRYQEDPVNTPSMVADPRDPNGWGYWNLGHANTDWWDVLFKDYALSHKHNVGIGGGSQNATYYVGLGWVDDAGKLNYADEKFQRFNLTSNVALQVTERLKLDLKAKFNRSYQKYYISQTVDDRTGIFTMLAIQWPTDPVYTPNGDFALDKNQPPVLALGGSDKQYTTDLWLNPSLELSLTDNWKINADFSYNYMGYKRGHHRAAIWGLATDGVTPVPHYSQNWNRMSQQLVHNEYATTNLFSDYSRQMGSHNFNVLIGGQAEVSNDMMLRGWRRDLVTEAVPAIRTAIGDMDVFDNMSHWSTLGTFARFSYNYDEKYLFELNGRYDGSSRFQRGRRWGFFPSASVGYNIWKEDFWRPLDNAINTFKLRASYGSLGNQNVANYLHEETIPINTNLPWIMDGRRPVYTTVPSNRSIGLTWESSETLNLGFDAEALDNRLAMTFEWYNRTTRNMFGPGESLPAIYGASVPLQNNATLQTKGVELSVNWRQVVNNDLDYNVGLVFSDNKTKVTEYNNPTKFIGNFFEGQTYGDIWGYVTEGLFQSDEEASEWVDQSQLYSVWGAGDVKYKDLNGDGRITRGNQTLDDPGDMKVIGNSTPRFMYGINANVNYKSFDLTMFWQGVGKRDLWMANQNFFGFRSSWTSTIIQAHSLDYWSPENPDAYFARPYLTAENLKNQQVQTRYLQDASYIRLKNLQLGYSLPQSLLSKLKIEYLRVYLSGENLVTFSNIMESFDPEANVRASGANLVYPLSKTYSAGLNITF